MMKNILFIPIMACNLRCPVCPVTIAADVFIPCGDTDVLIPLMQPDVFIVRPETDVELP
mgnify:CR=1 FL=1